MCSGGTWGHCPPSRPSCEAVLGNGWRSLTLEAALVVPFWARKAAVGQTGRVQCCAPVPRSLAALTPLAACAPASARCWPGLCGEAWFPSYLNGSSSEPLSRLCRSGHLCAEPAPRCTVFPAAELWDPPGKGGVFTVPCSLPNWTPSQALARETMASGDPLGASE